MSNIGMRGLAGLLAAAALAGCASSAAHGINFTGEQPYIATVEVIQHDKGAPAPFADALREVVAGDAAFYGSTGRPIILRIDVDKVHFKNPVQAMLIGDNNLLSGHVAVVDSMTGEQLGMFQIQADAEAKGINAGSMVVGVVGMFDPTGVVSIASAAANAASADINRKGTAGMMRVNFSAEALRQTFGDARTKIVIQARKDQLKKAQTRAPN